ncbi:MAG: hypothetical protein IPL06_04870 [Betaproteobacteria bacterium]|nr:hypothetical protein [Betaproteobacteria bacterium]
MRNIVFTLIFAVLALPTAAQSDFAKKFLADQREEALKALAKGKPLEQVKAAETLGPEEAAVTAPVLAGHLADPDAAVRLAAANALWDLAGRNETGFAPAKPALVKALDDADANVAMHAAGALSAMKVPQAELAPARRRVLREGGGTPYVRFLAGRGLIGIDPPLPLLPAMLPYLEEASTAAKRGGSRDNVDLARSAFYRLADTKDRSLLAPMQAEIRRGSPGTPVLMSTVGRFSPRPEDWTDQLLQLAGSQDKDIVALASDLLGYQGDAASLAKWMPRAAVLLGVSDRRDMALSAIWRVAGKTPLGLKELAALARDPQASEAQRNRALEILGSAMDMRGAGQSAEAARTAFPLWFPICDPVLRAGRPGPEFDRCLTPVAFAWADDREQAAQVAKWLAANPDVEAKIRYLGRLEGLWAKAVDAEPAVRAELAHAEPRVKLAAEKTLDRIRPAWREAGARQERTTTAGGAPAVSKAAPVPGAPGADGGALYGAVRDGDLAKVKKLVTRANVAQPVKFPQMQGIPPVPLVVAVNYCGIPQVPAAKLAEIVAYLVSIGADPDGKDNTGDNILDRAKYTCPPEVMKALAG